MSYLKVDPTVMQGTLAFWISFQKPDVSLHSMMKEEGKGEQKGFGALSKHRVQWFEQNFFSRKTESLVDKTWSVISLFQCQYSTFNSGFFKP